MQVFHPVGRSRHGISPRNVATQAALKFQIGTSKLPHIIPARCPKAVPCGERLEAVSARFRSCRGIGARQRGRGRGPTFLAAPSNPQPFAGRVLSTARRRPEPPHAGASPSRVGPRKGRTRPHASSPGTPGGGIPDNASIPWPPARLAVAAARGHPTGRPSGLATDALAAHAHRSAAHANSQAPAPQTSPHRPPCGPQGCKAGTRPLAPGKPLSARLTHLRPNRDSPARDAAAGRCLVLAVPAHPVLPGLHQASGHLLHVARLLGLRVLDD